MAVQVISVVIGILLALFINDWVTQKQQQASVNEATHAIRVELSANRDALRGNAARLDQLAKAILDSPRNRNQPARPCYMWDQWSGLGPVNITDAAYQASIATQAFANMPFQQAQRVAEIYGAQNNARKVSDLIFNKLVSATPQTLGVCISLVENTAYVDHQLAIAYAKLIGPDKTPWPKAPIPIPTASSAPASK